MASSKKLKALVRRIKFLEDNLLPAPKIDGNYTPLEKDLIKSFLLLVHGEIEAYFEDMVKARVLKSHDKFKLDSSVDICLAAVLSFAGSEVSFDGQNKRQLEFRLGKSVAHFLSNNVQKNHGIKEVNIYNLLVPVGIRISQLDVTWLSVMENFGTMRGNIAHNSVQVQNVIDRNSLVHMINFQILPEITVLDEILRKVK